MEDTFPHPQRQAERKHLRTAMRERRKALSTDTLAAADDAIATAVLRYIDSLATPVHRIAAYLAINGEAPLGASITACQSRGIAVYLPIIRGSDMLFAPFAPGAPMTRNRLGIEEPLFDASATIDPLGLDLVLVPLVAFTRRGERLGMGGGYYDRTFEARHRQAPPPHLVGIAHALQQVDDVFVEDWDVPLDAIITDAGLLLPTGQDREP